MSRSFIVDANLPVSLSELLVDLGHQSVHASESKLGLDNDMSIWRFANNRGMTIVSKDVDFAHLVKSSKSRSGCHLDEAWKCSQGGCS
jgi:predicted nuclease of predicted toxin-antitoxin system